MRDKRKLTEQLVTWLTDQDRITADSAMKIWWFNLRKRGGMRLTATGYQTFVHRLELEHYEFPVHDPMIFDKKLLLKLDNKMQMPYYIHAVKGIPKKVIFFGSREAVLANLYGNLQQFLDNYSA